MADIWERVASLNMSHIGDDELIQIAKAAQKAVNQRITRLEKAGLATKATTGGLKVTPLRNITTRAQARRAVNRARAMGENPISTPGAVRNLIKQTQKSLNEPKAKIKVAVDASGKPMAEVVGEDWKRPLKQTTLSEAENIRRFWHWIEEGAGKDKFYISDANVILHEALAKGVNAVSYAKRKLEAEKRQREAEDKIIMEGLFPENSRLV